jgi:hypothetical protein
VEVAKDVAATFHIEPNHNPKAGEPSQAWFALTRQGGTLIPLEDCNCTLKVFAEPRKSSVPPVLQPALKSTNVENYRGIPGAAIVFPKSGVYTLQLSGTPKGAATFAPFELNYSVTVLAGTPSSTPAAPDAAAVPSPQATTPPAPSATPSATPWPSIALISGLVVAGIATLYLQKKSRLAAKGNRENQ